MMECYNCGAELGMGDQCPSCGADVRIYRKILQASNAYYNRALGEAGVRNLTGAVISLRTSLRFNKLNIDARNLLGLVYLEMGEVVEALSEWVISKNYMPEGNLASRYLDEVQNNRSRLDVVNQTIKKYNQALTYCRQGSYDLAVLQLKKVLSLNPKLVRGHQLLALLYIQDNKYELARKSLRSAAAIDVDNVTTLRYLKEVDADRKGSDAPKKPKNPDQISYRSGNETIIQPKHRRGGSALGTVANMVIGIALGAAITYFLIVPGVRREMQNAEKAQAADVSSELAVKEQAISTLEAQVEELTAQMEEEKAEEENTASRVSSYEQLLQAFSAYSGGDIEAAGNAFANVNQEYLSEEAKSVYETVNAMINADYIKTLYDTGYSLYQAQNYAEAAENLQKVVDADVNYESGYALYYLAQSYRKADDLETAKIYYQKVIELYPGTERARTAQNYVDAE